MKTLVRGQKLKLSEISSQKQFVVGIQLAAPSLVLDVSCFGLDANGILSDDRFFVFYNQTTSPGEAIKLLGAQGGDTQVFWVDLARLPASITRLVFVVSIDGVGAMRQLAASYWRVLTSSNGSRWSEAAKFPFIGTDFNDERALMVAEFYLKDEWRLAAIGQGFSGGLDAVLRQFGGQEVDPPAPVQSPTVVSPPRYGTPITPVTPSRAVAPAPVMPLSAGMSQNLHSPDVPRVPDGKNCTRCGAMISFWEKTTGRYNASTGRCGQCEKIVAEQQQAAQVAQQAAQVAREANKRTAIFNVQSIFANAWRDGALDPHQWRATQSAAHAGGIGEQELRDIIWNETQSRLKNLVAMIAADGVVTDEEERVWSQTLKLLSYPPSSTAALQQSFAREKSLAAIRQGQLPHVNDTGHSLHLEAGEICHLVTSAQFAKVLASGTTYLPMTMVATNKKLYLIEQSGGGREIAYSKFLRVTPNNRAISLSLSVKAGAGTYQVNDPQYVDAVLTTLVRMSKRQLVQGKTDTRHIPQHVKTAVWVRDGGKCVECSDQSYLEYDHVIPFSKGGATSVDNLRILCRRCNLAKGDRI